MFLIVELNTATLDYGVAGFTPILMWLLFAMMIGISMIPYAFLYHSLLEKRAGHAREFAAGPWHKMTAWMHAHHPRLLHHH